MYGAIEENKDDRLKNYISETLCGFSKQEKKLSRDETDTSFWKYTIIREILEYAFLSKHYVKHYDVTTYRYTEGELEAAKPLLANMIVDKIDLEEKEVALNLLDSIKCKRNSRTLTDLEILVLYCYDIQERELDKARSALL